MDITVRMDDITCHPVILIFPVVLRLPERVVKLGMGPFEIADTTIIGIIIHGFGGPPLQSLVSVLLLT